MKKLVSWLLAAALAAVMLTVPALAAEVPGSGGILNASQNALGVISYSYVEGETLVEIPAVYVYPEGTTFTWTLEDTFFLQIYDLETYSYAAMEWDEVFTPQDREVYAFEIEYADRTGDDRIVTTYFKIGDSSDLAPAEEPAETVGGFSDVPAGTYYADAVLWAVEQGITTGTSAVTFSPEATCTRAQILTFLWRAVGAPEPQEPNPFLDVFEDSYYAKAARWAREAGLFPETPGSYVFLGETPCTRSETVTYLWRLAGSPAAGGNSFTDVPAGADYAQAVTWAVEQGVTTGTGAATFSPEVTCTRAQIVTFLYRALA